MTLVKTKTRTKLPASERKRSGMHHRKTRNYTKAYWPYIPIILVFVIGFLVNGSLSSHSKVLGASSNFTDQSLLDATNAQRSGDKEASLNLNSELDNAAQSKANDMTTKNYWSHDTPSGQTPWSFITAAGYNYQLAGENLAYGFSNASDTITGWMNSPEHRANILNANYQDVGFGIASSPNYVGKGPEVLVVAMYAEPATGTATSITFNVPPPNAVLGDSSSNSVSSSQTPVSLVSRIQLLTGGKAVWSLTALSFLTGILICLFVIRHTRRLKRLFKDGEKLVARHYVLDIVVAIVIVVGFILTRTSGVIR